MNKEYISEDIENAQHYLGELFALTVSVCIAGTEDIVRGALGYEIADMRREPSPNCVTAFQYSARIEWAPLSDDASWRLMYVLYRRDTGHRSKGPKPVEEIERRPLLEMPIDVQRFAHPHLFQLVAAAGGEWQWLRKTMSLTFRAARITSYSPD